MFVDVRTTHTGAAILPHPKIESFCSEGRMKSGMEKTLAYAASGSRLGSTFDSFLFAPIGDDGNGLPLSVVSAIARMDLDPWQEAATLAGLPADTAARKLATIFSVLPDQSLCGQDRETVAARLIALLPRPRSSLVRSTASLAGVRAVISSRLSTSVLLFSLYMLVLLASQFLMTRHDSPAPGADTHATPSLTSAQQTPPPATDE